MSLSKLSLYFHTLRHLRARQFFYRARNLLPRRSIAPVSGCALREPQNPTCDWVTKPDSFGAPDQFIFLNEAGALGAIGWQGPEKSALWRYNQHYFDWLGSASAREHEADFATLTARWIDENPPPMAPAWDPYPTSLRVVNWVKAFLGGQAMAAGALDHLASQANHLNQRIEWHLLANHLFANGKALVFAGLALDTPRAEHWLRAGLSILRRELDEQVLSDGGHFERSPMYHAVILEDCLDLLNLCRAYARAETRPLEVELQEKLPPMLACLDVLTLPDDDVAFFNDSTGGIAPAPEALRAYAARLGVPNSKVARDGFVNLPAMGYVRHRGADHVAIMAVGSVGPDYQPGHAHADTLSFELALFGQRFIVNSGVSEYGVSTERLRQRGTAAHSTVQVDGANSSEVWSGFRVARRARAFDLVLDEPAYSLTCSHNGYRRLPGRPVHRRKWQFGAKTLCVTDHITGHYTSAEARFYIHPAWRLSKVGDGVLCTCGKLSVRVSDPTGAFDIIPSTYHPMFNQTIASQCLVAPVLGGHGRIEFSWT